MRQISKEELAAILTAHSLWLTSGQVKGARADLSSANLSSANLSSADLSWADLRWADLSSANLSLADLRSADLSSANLSSANLSSADLSWADLRWADLSSADLSSANLSLADLRSADLSWADLSSANLSLAKNLAETKNSDLTLAQTSIVPETGPFEGWKKCEKGVIVRVLIPAKAKRSSATGRKCRAEFVKVLEVIGDKVGISKHDESVTYKKGATVKCHEWNENRFEECGGGIHFFLTKIEAENY